MITIVSVVVLAIVALGAVASVTVVNRNLADVIRQESQNPFAPMLIPAGLRPTKEEAPESNGAPVSTGMYK